MPAFRSSRRWGVSNVLDHVTAIIRLHVETAGLLLTMTNSISEVHIDVLYLFDHCIYNTLLSQQPYPTSNLNQILKPSRRSTTSRACDYDAISNSISSPALPHRPPLPLPVTIFGGIVELVLLAGRTWPILAWIDKPHSADAK